MATSSSNGAALAQHVLSATYTSPTNEPFSFSQTFAAPDASNVEKRSNYLSNLRAAVVETQEKINKELTARMEEDKARDATAGAKVADVDEVKEEENYGEEVVEEDDE